MSAPADAQMAGEYLVFTLDGEPCAITIRCIREVIEYQPTTAVPNAPPTIRGVIDLRGRVVPIVDLAVKFGFARSPQTKWTCLIVVEARLEEEASLLAIVADTVDEVIELHADNILPPPSFGTRIRNEYLVALAKVGGKFALVLDVDRLLTLDEILSVNAPAGEERPAP